MWIVVAAAIISAQSFASARESAASYLIQPGDNLLGIAATTGVQVDRLVSLNGITNPDFIVAGQTLSLDGSAQIAVHGPIQSTSDAYTIKTGDTLWSIAQSNGVSVESLIQLNNLPNADQLTVGQVVRLPPEIRSSTGWVCCGSSDDPSPCRSTKSSRSPCA